VSHKRELAAQRRSLRVSIAGRTVRWGLDDLATVSDDLDDLAPVSDDLLVGQIELARPLAGPSQFEPSQFEDRITT
jgi:hypothetical protein